MEQLTGRIHRSTAGFYTVALEQGGTIECRAKGVFRKQGGTSPLVGDFVTVQQNADGSGTVSGILPRRNALIRPPLANLDCMVVVISVSDPPPNLLITDKYLCILESKGIEPVIAITKSDLDNPAELVDIYTASGFSVYPLSKETREGIPELYDRLAGCFCAFCGNSGVGKSSLLNTIDPRFSLETGDTSKKLGRGRHTTRHVEIFTLENGGMVADTPGFSSIDLLMMSAIGKDELPDCFREFAPYLGKCRYLDCAHLSEPDCAVTGAVRDGLIPESRYKSYEMIYNEVKDIKKWERKA